MKFPFALSHLIKVFFALLVLSIIPISLFAGNDAAHSIGGIRIEFILFGLTLLGVALFHNQTFWVAIIGLSSIILYKLFFIQGYPFAEHFFGANP
jgi:hypothetical protein